MKRTQRGTRTLLLLALVLAVVPLYILTMQSLETSSPESRDPRSDARLPVTQLLFLGGGWGGKATLEVSDSSVDLKMSVDPDELEYVLDRARYPEGRQARLLLVEPLMHNPAYCHTLAYHSSLGEESTTPPYQSAHGHSEFVPARGWLPADERLDRNTTERIDWIFYVHSSVGNVARRQVIRRTWGYPRLFRGRNSRILFVVGRSEAPNHQRKLEMEYALYGDILQGDFVDSYRNLTYKAVFALRWLSTYCGHVPIVMKADDDTFVNIFRMKDHLVRYSRFPPGADYSIERESRDDSRRDGAETKGGVKLLANTPKTRGPDVVSPRTIVCNVYEEGSMPIMRDRKSCLKWCVSRMDLPGMDTFPRYCSGLVYFFTMPLVRRLCDKVPTTPFLWIDDVYVTGLLPKSVSRVSYVNIREVMTLNAINAANQYKNLSEPLTYHVVHAVNSRVFSNLWNLLLDRLEREQVEELSLPVEKLKLRTTIL